MKRIKIIIPSGEVKAELIDKNPKTADVVWKSLPIEAEANRWGDEIYFDIPVEIGLENSQQEVEVGDMAYWPPGTAFCIFFGRTPISTSNKPKAYSPVNVFGKIIDNIEILKKIKDGDKIKIMRR